MEAQTKQPDALRKWMERSKQSLPSSNECGEVGYSRGEAFRPGDIREVAELDLERDRAAGHFGPCDPVPGKTGDALELGGEAVGIAQILVERALGADRLVGPVGLDLALVDAAANPPIPV